MSHVNQHRTQRPQRWLLPSHFTIPILSPFTSVVGDVVHLGYIR